MAILFSCGSSHVLANESALSPVADAGAIVVSGEARFTILTPALIRMEWSKAKAFEDRASFTFVNRQLDVPKFETRREGDWLIVATDALTLRYLDDGQPFSAKNLSITLQVLGKPVVWQPEMPETGNLRGTTRTLDGVSGSCPLEKGILSRDGWSVVDDSKRLLFADDPPHWVEQRINADSLDWYFFGYGHNYKQALQDYTKVAGSIPVPPRYVFGTWWSRYWAYSDAELRKLISEFNEHDVPLDVLVIDLDWHLDGWTGYTWNPKYFPDPDGFLKEVHEQGLRTTLNLHPHDGVGKHEAAFADVAKAMGLTPDKIDGVPFDCTDPRYIAAYFKYLHHPKERQGIDFWWMDWQQGEETKIPGLDPLFWLNHLHWRDMATNPDRDGKRPLVFSRWGGLGNHRYQVGFSGDTFCNWPSLAFQPYFTSTAGNVGYAYWSHDIGGHQPGKVDPELYTRWVQFGVFSPILRTHTSKSESAERRIWKFPAENFAAMREAFRLRYELIPYIYTMARKCHDTALPLCRPLYYEWPNLDEAYDNPGEYLFGDDLLVAPVCKPANPVSGMAEAEVWLPPGRWVNWFTDAVYVGPGRITFQVGLNEIPVFARAGAMIPAAPPVNRSDLIADAPLVIHVFAGADGRAELYEDDGLSKQYESDGFARTRVSHSQSEDRVTVTVQPTQGRFAGMNSERICEFRFHASPTLVADNGIQLNGHPVEKAAKGKAGWWYDHDTMCLVVRTPELSRSKSLQVVLNLDGKDQEQVEVADGLRARLRAIRDVENLLSAQPTSADVSSALAGLERLSNPRDVVTLVNSAWRRTLDRVRTESLTNEVSTKALMRLFGVVCSVEANPQTVGKQSGGEQSGGESAVQLDFAISLGPETPQSSPTDAAAAKWSATVEFDTPQHWQLLDGESWRIDSLAVSDALHGSGRIAPLADAQTTVLSGTINVTVGDTNIKVPLRRTVLPSINRWWIVGPFDAPNTDRLKTPFPPEAKVDLAASYKGKDNQAIAWQKVARQVTPESDLGDEFFVEFHKCFDGYIYNSVAYGFTYLRAPRDMDVVLAIGSDDGVAVWLNGSEVYRHDVGRPFTSKQDRVKVRLKKGSNTLLLKISQGGGMWGFSTHVETPDGQPALDVTNHLEP
jgi:alpha-glucosidase